MNANDIPPHYLSRTVQPPDARMTHLEWVAYVLVAVALAVFGVFMLLKAAGWL